MFDEKRWIEETVKDLRDWARELASQADPYPSKQAEILFDAVRIIKILGMRNEELKSDKNIPD